MFEAPCDRSASTGSSETPGSRRSPTKHRTGCRRKGWRSSIRPTAATDCSSGATPPTPGRRQAEARWRSHPAGRERCCHFAGHEARSRTAVRRQPTNEARPDDQQSRVPTERDRCRGVSSLPGPSRGCVSEAAAEAKPISGKKPAAHRAKAVARRRRVARNDVLHTATPAAVPCQADGCSFAQCGDRIDAAA